MVVAKVVVLWRFFYNSRNARFVTLFVASQLHQQKCEPVIKRMYLALNEKRTFN